MAMSRNTIREWLDAHPEVAGFVFVATIYLLKFLEVTAKSGGSGYEGP